MFKDDFIDKEALLRTENEELRHVITQLQTSIENFIENSTTMLLKHENRLTALESKFDQVKIALSWKKDV